MAIILEVLFYLCFVGLTFDHLVTGFVAVYFIARAKSSFKHLYGIDIPKNEFVTMLLKPWGTLGFFAGLVGVLVLLELETYKHFLLLLIILLLMRFSYRVKYVWQGMKVLKLSPQRNWLHVSIIVLCIIVFAWKYLSMVT